MSILRSDHGDEIIFRCDCGSRDHEVSFYLLGWDQDDYSIVIMPRLCRGRSIFGRLRAAFTYVFFPHKDGYEYEEFILWNKDEVDSIIQFLSRGSEKMR